MLALLRASRQCLALLWAMALTFALAPVITAAYGALFVHDHAHADREHVHHSHGHHHHGHHHHDHDGHHHDDDATDDGADDAGQNRLHVHYEASCPSVLMPVLMANLVQHLPDRLTIPVVEARQGAPPERLLRPPILLL
jgi:hypothetical protein